MNAPHRMPGAWYDLSGRVSEAQAVASCALESLSSGRANINLASNLIAAVQDILGLMEQDVNLMEEQLKP
ncbi:MAG: hypothetical protein Q8P42_09370 [Gallionella sp.]|nr:hypothetical protein [Gallionella sp.]